MIYHIPSPIINTDKGDIIFFDGAVFGNWSFLCKGFGDSSLPSYSVLPPYFARISVEKGMIWKNYRNLMKYVIY